MPELILGVDDTDSREKGMCTTYLASLVAESVSGFAEVKETVLFRLNPNVPYKTRGNACLSVRLETRVPERVRETAESLVEEHAVLSDDDTNPGLAFYVAENDVPEALVVNALETVREVKEVDEVKELAEKHGVEAEGWGNGRGIVGAVAAVGAEGALERYGDSTYELLAYRDEEEWGKRRKVDFESFVEADEATYPDTWDTVDGSTGDVVCVPNTPGPVVYGLRGSFEGVWEANTCVEVEEGYIEGVRLFRTNQGTDMHLVELEGEPEEWRSYRVEGHVSSEPETREGGHVFFGVETESCEMECAAFEPTKGLREEVRELREGDAVTVCGGYKDGTLNVEKIRVEEVRETEEVKPECCGRRMESAGRNQGYRCRECGETAESKVEVEVERGIDEGWYEVPPSARRHLSKPLVRGVDGRRSEPS